MVFDEFGYDEDGVFCQFNTETGEFKELPDCSEEQEKLQDLWDSQKDEDNWDFEILCTEDDYWWAIPLESRHFYDKGEFLGVGVKQAENTLKQWLR